MEFLKKNNIIEKISLCPFNRAHIYRMYRPFRNVVNVVLRHIQNYKAHQSFQVCLMIKRVETNNICICV